MPAYADSNVPKLGGRLVLGLFLAFVAFLSPLRAASRQSSPFCGIDETQAADRVFANPDGGVGWREYRSVQQVPELQKGFGQLAQLWNRRGSGPVVNLQGPSEDFAASTDYCFDANGALRAVRYEVRTAWGWGFRESGSVSGGRFLPGKSEFFDTRTELPVSRPEQAASVPDALKPQLYSQESELPFFHLLGRSK